MGLEFENNVWNQHPWICQLAKFLEKKKIPKSGTKNALFGYFWANIFKNFYHIWNQHPRFCLIAKFYVETRMSKFGTKSLLLRLFLKICHICHIWNPHPWICFVTKLNVKITILKFGTKNVWLRRLRIDFFLIMQNFVKKWKCLNKGLQMPYLGIFGLEFEKNIVVFEINTFEFI